MITNQSNCVHFLIEFVIDVSLVYRYYILRERPTAGSRSDNIMEDLPIGESGEGALLGLPESETDLDVSDMPSFDLMFFEFIRHN